jgi:hypothetical protein
MSFGVWLRKNQWQQVEQLLRKKRVRTSLSTWVIVPLRAQNHLLPGFGTIVPVHRDVIAHAPKERNLYLSIEPN